MPWPIEDLELARPPLAWALALPVLLLLTARYATRPLERATGALALWRRVVAEEPPRGARRRPRVPPALWLAAASLLSGALALAGPRLARERRPVTWTVVVDPSPSTGLVWIDPAEPDPPDAGGATRRERAVRAALAWLGDAAGPRDRARWISPVRETLELAAGEAPPAAWLASPPWHAEAPRFALHDEPRALWITDAAAALQPRSAGLFASGGAAVPGPVGCVGRDLVRQDGDQLVREADAAPSRAVAVGEVPAVVERIARAWAQARGFRFVRDTSDGASLVVRADIADANPAEVVAGRDGWRAVGRAAGASREAEGPGPREVWLTGRTAGGRELPLVIAAPGDVRLGWTELGEPTGDPAAFAVSWSELFDAWMLPVAGVVPLSERAAAGAPVERAPRGVAAEGELDSLPRAGIDAWLSLAAAGLALAALAAGVLRRN